MYDDSTCRFVVANKVSAWNRRFERSVSFSAIVASTDVVQKRSVGNGIPLKLFERALHNGSTVVVKKSFS